MSNGTEQLIFNPQTYQLLGERTVIGGKVTDSAAVLNVKVVGTLPPGKISPARTATGRIVNCLR